VRLAGVSALRIVLSLAALGAMLSLGAPAGAGTGASASTPCTPAQAGKLSPAWGPGVRASESLVVSSANRHGLDPDLLAAAMQCGTLDVAPGAAFPWQVSTPAADLDRAAFGLGAVISDTRGDLAAALAVFDPDTSNQVMDDYARALAARDCLPAPDGAAQVILHSADTPAVLPVAGCAMRLYRAYRSERLTTYLALAFCDQGAPQPGSAWRWPMRSTKLVRGFSAEHPGWDLSGHIGQAVTAAAAGTVRFAGWSEAGYGNLVVVEHPNQVQTWYAHLQYIVVTAGQAVQAGDQVGVMGGSGNADGWHLHFEVRERQQPVDPAAYLVSDAR
jgi:hypothetical protein